MRMLSIIFTFFVISAFLLLPIPSLIPKLYAQLPYYPPLIHIDKQSYRIGVDRNTGTIYEFFNKRSDSNQNTVHANMGAAVQVAVHNGPNPHTGCLGMGYWNPTQAGAACAYPLQATGAQWVKTPIAGSGYDVYCDHGKNNTCTQANSTITHSSFQLMNFDYAPEYPGPYNPNDLLFLEQKLSAKDSYVQVDLTIVNKGIDRAPSAVQIPSYIFIGTYKDYAYVGSDGVVYHSVLTNNTTLPEFSGNFITLSNPDKMNSSITIAWLYSPEFMQDIITPYYAIDNAPFEGTNYINFYNAPRINLKANKPYKLRYYIFPYAFNSSIQSEYGTLTVKEYIDKLKTTNIDYILGDLNADSHITLIDFVLFMNYWWTNALDKVDYNHDGKINVIDYTIFMNAWHESV